MWPCQAPARRARAPRLAKAPASVTEAVLGPAGVLQGEVLLAPFLSFRDLLRLSRASRWLKPFRFQLESLRVRVPPRLTGAKDSVRDLATALISRQRRIERLYVEEGWLVGPALTALKDGASRGRSLTTLMQGLEAALTSGACPALQVLKIGSCVLTDEHFECLAAAIRANAIRGLRVLKIGSEGRDGAVGMRKLMEALEAGGCPMLTDLCLRVYACMDGGGGQALAGAVRACVIPGLARLNLNSCYPGLGALAPLVEALAEGWCPHLQAVDLTRVQVTEAEMLPLLRAVGEGRLREVRSLSFQNQIGGAGMQALVEAMGRGQEIEELSIYGSSLTEQDFLLLVGPCGLRPQPSGEPAVLITRRVPSMSRQAEGLRGGGGRWMRRLDLCWMAGLTEPALAALGGALREGACPQLAVLTVRRSMSEGWVGDPLARAITTGALPLLKELELYGCRIGAEAARGLAAAFKAGVGPDVRRAVFTWACLETTVAQALRAAIMEGCPGVRKNSLRIHG
jgi:hypothetical protein